MNPNVLHRWVIEHERYGHHILSDDDRQDPVPASLMVPTPEPAAQFLPVSLSPNQSPVGNEAIRLELKRGVTRVCICWPVSAAAQCAELMREWLR